MEILGQSSEALFEYNDETLIAYACNDIRIREFVRIKAKVESDVVNHEQGSLTCEIAYKMKLLEQQSAMAEAMSSSESCRAEMSKELEVVHEIHRSLSEMGGHHVRKLFGFFLYSAFIVALLAGTFEFKIENYNNRSTNLLGRVP